MISMMSLRGKVVFITGASSGIGLACAEAYAAEGAMLLLAARRNDRLEKNRDRLRELGAADVHVLPLDVTKAAAVADAISGLPKAWEDIEVLVNNAGLSRGLDKLYAGSLQDWEEMIDTNVKGVAVRLARRRTRDGDKPGTRPCSESGIDGFGELTYPNGAVYCATKAAERAINDGLRLDL